MAASGGVWVKSGAALGLKGYAFVPKEKIGAGAGAAAETVAAPPKAAKPSIPKVQEWDEWRVVTSGEGGDRAYAAWDDDPANAHASEAWGQGLSYDERGALGNYQTPQYRAINAYLRDPEGVDVNSAYCTKNGQYYHEKSEIASIAGRITSALSRSELARDTVLHRFQSKLSPIVGELRDAPLGHIWTEKALVSATYDAEYAAKGAFHSWNSSMTKGGVIMRIVAKKATKGIAGLGAAGQWNGESEVLINAGKRFRLLDRRIPSGFPSSGNMEVVVEVMD
jgi:hypothetical protein